MTRYNKCGILATLLGRPCLLMATPVHPGFLKEALGQQNSPEDSIPGLTVLDGTVSIPETSGTPFGGVVAGSGAKTPPKEKVALQTAFTGEVVPLDHSQFKDSNGRYRTVSLFYETNNDKKYPSFFTLKDRDTNGYTSMRKMYLDMMDLTEYRFAQKALGSWDHWQKLCKNYWFKDVVSEWRKELQLKLSSEQLHHMRELAKRNDAIGLSAARALLAQTKPQTRGRPSKNEIARELKEASEAESLTAQDAERLGVVTQLIPRNVADNG